MASKTVDQIQDDGIELNTGSNKQQSFFIITITFFVFVKMMCLLMANHMENNRFQRLSHAAKG